MYCYSLKTMKCPPGIPICIRDSYQGATSPMHHHDYMEIAIIRQGSGEHVIRNNDGSELRTSVIKGDVFVILDGENHYYKTCRNFRLYNICVAGNTLISLDLIYFPCNNIQNSFLPKEKLK